MKKHTKVYLNTFYPDFEFDKPLCEICGKIATDIHHIDAGWHKRSDHPALLIGLCREDHIKYGDKKQFFKFLMKKHEQFIIRKLGKIPEEWILLINNYGFKNLQ